MIGTLIASYFFNMFSRGNRRRKYSYNNQEPWIYTVPKIDENYRDIYIKSHRYIITGTVFLSLNNNYSNHI